MNPYYFLKHEFRKRSHRSRLWYTSICHGDLNMQNVLVDARDNIYVIDFSETRPRNIVSDFARLEPIVKFEQVPIESSDDLLRLLIFEQGLLSATTLDHVPNEYPGSNAAVDKAHDVIALMRELADTATIFETDIVPYWLALLEWTLPVIVFRQCTAWQKRYAAYSAGLIVEAIVRAEEGSREAFQSIDGSTGRGGPRTSKQHCGRPDRSQHSCTGAATISATRLSIARHTPGCFPVNAASGQPTPRMR